MEKLLRQFNFSEQEINIFKLLLDSGGSTVSETAKTAKIKRTSCQEVIRSLEEKGFVVQSKIGNKFFYQTEDPDTFAQIINERQFLVDKLIVKLNQNSIFKPWKIRLITHEEADKLTRRAKRKGLLSHSFMNATAALRVVADGRIILNSTDQDNPAFEIKSDDLAAFHALLSKY